MAASDATFYARPSAVLRLGDIVRVTAATEAEMATLAAAGDERGFSINVRRPRYCAIMSPCCSIKDKVLCLSPLSQVRQDFFKNPYFEEDLTCLNRPVPPQCAVPPAHWDNLSAEEQAKRMNAGPTYAVVEVFVYPPSDFLPTYHLTGQDRVDRTIGHYMVDFRSTFKVVCPEADRSTDLPADLKVLELSALTRRDLREKMGYYYARETEEDRALLGG